MPKLSEDEINDFLTNFDYVMKLATLSSDGYPYVVPIWYFYEEEELKIFWKNMIFEKYSIVRFRFKAKFGLDHITVVMYLNLS